MKRIMLTYLENAVNSREVNLLDKKAWNENSLLISIWLVMITLNICSLLQVEIYIIYSVYSLTLYTFAEK